MPKIGILIDRPSYSARAEGRLLTGYEQNLLMQKCFAAGLAADDIYVSEVHNYASVGCHVLIPMGETPLQILTGKKSIWKWHLSPLDGPGGIKVVPTFDFANIMKDWSLGLYLEMAIRKAAKYATPGPWTRKEERYRLGISADEAISLFDSLLERPPEWLSLDIETGRGQINTFGVAWTGSDAAAVKVLPDGMPPVQFHRLWRSIAALCESQVPKVMQNGLYERMYLSRYGIRINAFNHDTMCAQKFLWPELEKGLDNVGRIYTMEPYWKDDGRVAAEEGKQKDWGDIRDWTRHFTYNCRDTSNTLIAALAQREDLKQRGLLALHDDYLVKLYNCVYEMGATGLPLNVSKQAALIAEYEQRSSALVKRLSQEINPRSSKAKLKLLKDKGYEMPKKRATGKESADELSLKKLRLKHPDDGDLKILLEIASVEKALSSYLRVRTLPDKRIRFMLDPHGTETGRMSCGKDPWDGGFNAQTMNDYTKRMIEWPADMDRVFVEVDLKAAETWFVAYDANEDTLLSMLHRKEDIHRYVAAEIYGKPMCDVTKDERQLGKKSGHGANYSMGVSTFQDSCLKEMDLVIDGRMAKRVLESYHKLFPKIRKWHERIRDTVYRERRLTNPLGRVRYFYGRTDDTTYREAYAYRPQSTVPDLINTLMLALCAQRTEGAANFTLHMQCHDSLLISCERTEVDKLARFAFDLDKWQPGLELPAGRLQIPVEIKVGRNLGEVKEYQL